MNTTTQLHGKCALVTGAGTAGIGRAIALELARRGADVVVHDRTREMADQTAVLLHGLGVRVFALAADFSSMSAARLLVQNAHDCLGRLVIVSSVNEDRVIAEQAHYCASKGGLRQWGRALAASLGPVGVRVNLLCPGAIDTPMNHAHLVQHPERREVVLARTPLRRLGEPADIGCAAAFLAGDDSRFMTGASLFVDGGLSLG